MRLRPSLTALVLGACQTPVADSSAAATTPGITSVSDAASGSSSDASSTGTTTPADDSSSAASTDTTAPAPDLGTTPDFGDGTPLGCRGKIDFLFVVARNAHMSFHQDQLAAAVPEFIDVIESKFADFDHHIMVIDGDGPPPGAWWGSSLCTEMCSNPACTVGQPCCPYDDADKQGEPCCDDPNYPCDDLDLVSACDQAWGAGTVFPAGAFTADKICPIDASRRYLVKGQTDLESTFDCIIKVGNSGYGMLGQALTAAMQKDINAVGGCNQGFLRDDALLMVTFIAANPDDEGILGSDGTPDEWAQAVRDAKHGDDESIVMLNIGGGVYGCKFYDRICQLAEMFPYHRHELSSSLDYMPAFLDAAEFVETACAGFTPPG